MITKEKARKILKDNDEDYSSDEIQKILEDLQRQAKIIEKQFQNLTSINKSTNGEKKI